MGIYLHNASAISPQATASLNDLLALENADSHFVIEPPYTEWLTPAMLRRMSRIIKMGVASGMQALTHAEGRIVPDAIISGTGFGCFEDSEKFLEQMVVNHESVLSPTPFIQSTHNTVSAQIALLLGCYGYNFTHVHGGLSFENSLIDTMLYLKKHSGSRVLVGAADELTKNYIQLRKEAENKQDQPLNLGEGAAFFLASDQSQNAVCKIKAVKTLVAEDELQFQNKLKQFIDAQKLKPSNVSLILNGIESTSDNGSFGDLAGTTFDAQFVNFKQYCGEFYTASSFALWLAFNVYKSNSNAGLTLIANQYNHNQYALILLENVEAI
jgi:hypothetical protein